MTVITVARRDKIHGRDRSAFASPACRAVRRQVPGARLVTAGRTSLSYVLLDGWRVRDHVVIPLPPGSPEPPGPRLRWLGPALRLAPLLAASAMCGSWLVLAGVIR